MGFFFNGTHSDEYKLIVKTKRQILSDLSDGYIEIPGRDGSYLVPGRSKDKIIAVKCQLEFDNLASLRLLTRDIAAWLHTDSRAELVFDDEPDIIYQAKPGGAIDFETAKAFGEFSVVFRAEPFAYGAEVSQNLNTNNVVTRLGSAPAVPSFTAVFNQAATEYKILHVDTGKFVRVIKSFAVNDTLLIEHKVGRVALNDIVIMTALDLASDFFVLDRITNTFTITPAGVATTTIVYNPRWL